MSQVAAFALTSLASNPEQARPNDSMSDGGERTIGIHRPVIICNESARSGSDFDPASHSGDIERAVLECSARSESLERPGQIVPLVTSSDQEIDSRCMSGSSIATISSSTARNCLGVYTLTMYPSNGGEKKLLVKVVRSPDYEVETITATTEVLPNLLNDPRCSVPFCIIDVVYYEDDVEDCDGGDGAREQPVVVYHIHVSRFESQCTVPLSDLLMKWWFSSSTVSDIVRLCQAFGSFLAAFHRDYPQLNHGDMNPTNILVGTNTTVLSEGSMDPPAEYKFVLVDCGGMDIDPSSGGSVADMETFRRAIEEMGILYGGQFVALTWRSVLDGYHL